MTPNIPVDSNADQQLGANYAKALEATKVSTLQLRQAMLLDLLGPDRSLWPALRHLIEQPGFEACSSITAQPPVWPDVRPGYRIWPPGAIRRVWRVCNSSWMDSLA